MVFETGQPLRVDDLHMADEMHHWNPRLQSDAAVQPNLGSDGVASGAWWRSGGLIDGWCQFRFAGTGIHSGDPATLFNYVYAPVPPDRSLIQRSRTGSYGQKIGSGRLRDNSAFSNSILITVQFAPFPINGMIFQIGDSGQMVNRDQPFIWSTDDAMSFNFTYPANEQLLA